MSSIATISRQGGRRYRQFGSTSSINARPLAFAVHQTLVNGPLIFPAADTYQRGGMAGSTYRRGIAAADVYQRGAVEGEST